MVHLPEVERILKQRWIHPVLKKIKQETSLINNFSTTMPLGIHLNHVDELPFTTSEY
jgi:hypothetical protein